MDPIFELHSIFHRFAAGDMSLAEFERAFLPYLPALAARADSDPFARLGTEVDDFLVEIGEGELSEGDLRAFLDAALQNPTVDVGDEPAVRTTTAGAKTVVIAPVDVQHVTFTSAARPVTASYRQSAGASA